MCLVIKKGEKFLIRKVINYMLRFLKCSAQFGKRLLLQNIALFLGNVSILLCLFMNYTFLLVSMYRNKENSTHTA